MHAFHTVEEATDAVRTIETDYARASAHALAVARDWFAADRVLRELLATAGL